VWWVGSNKWWSKYMETGTQTNKQTKKLAGALDWLKLLWS